MLKNKKIVYFCQECGYESSKWMGQCPGCRAWNTFVEETVSAKKTSSVGSGLKSSSRRAEPVVLKDIRLSEDERRKIDTLTRIMQEEFLSTDHLQDEMLRVLLKRFIILCTRIAEDRQGAVRENSLQFETIRKFYVLVDTYFKEKKQVQEYADMLNKSPKTLANILSAYQQPSAIRIIHNRIQAEARRLLLYTAKSSKEIALMLGFEDQAAFSRFFKNAAGLSATEYRHQYKK